MKLHSKLLIAFCSLLLFTSCSRQASLEDKREQMIQRQLIWRGITDEPILKTFRMTKREEFVLPAFRHKAYDDLEVPIGEGQNLDRPYEDAMMIKAMNIQPGDKVLEVGTGAGYVAALMSPLAKEVHTIEILEPLATSSRQRLERLGYQNVKVYFGDGFKGIPSEAPFDSIILTCSPDNVPSPLVEQLKEGGRIVLPLGSDKRFQRLLVYTKQHHQLKLVQELDAATFVPMEGIIKEKTK
ncbi:MAG: protein-L-isoaspartate(D-aspartate) O-methyltransferase [Deltaproteobacteria bacterium]|nr:protein-L-isoaspartate(D-aspartate) O-methyltransferase [Deltaproteobacteria bacterium]